MWFAWVALSLAVMAHRWRDMASRLSLMIILAGLLAIQPVRMVLEHEPEKVAVAMIWVVAACFVLTVKGGKMWRVSLYLAATVPCVFLGRVLPMEYGALNPGVILSHLFGTLAILEAGYGTSNLVGIVGMGFGDWIRRSFDRLGLAGSKEGTS